MMTVIAVVATFSAGCYIAMAAAPMHAGLAELVAGGILIMGKAGRG